MQITPYGTKMSKLPVDVEWANLILKSDDYNCVPEILTSVAMLSAENIFHRPSNELDAQKGNTYSNLNNTPAYSNTRSLRSP